MRSALIVLAACGASEPLSRGPVTLTTQPSARVDFMTGDLVHTTATTDGSGRIEANISRGDHAVIIGTETVVIDALAPERDYTWLLPGAPEPRARVEVTWSEVSNAASYRVESRCGSIDVTAPPAAIDVCDSGDAIVIVARGERYREIIGYAHHTVATLDASITVTEPFEAPRYIGYFFDGPFASDIAAVSSFVTNERVRIADATSFSVENVPAQGGFFFPARAGVTRTEVTLLSPIGSALTALDQRAVADAYESIELDFAWLPVLDGAATFDAATSTVHWALKRDGGADAVMVRVRTTAGDVTLISPYAGTTVTIPALPPDLGTVTNTASPVFVSAGGDYDGTVSKLGRVLDPTYPTLQLVTSTLPKP